MSCDGSGVQKCNFCGKSFTFVLQCITADVGLISISFLSVNIRVIRVIRVLLHLNSQIRCSAVKKISANQLNQPNQRSIQNTCVGL